MGLFKKKKNAFDEIKYAYENLTIPRYEELQYMPIGDFKTKAIEAKQLHSNILHITEDENDMDYVKSAMLQIIKREESMIVLDPDGKLYNKFKIVLQSKNYRIRYIDIDDEECNTWNFFDNDKIDIHNPNAANDVFIKCAELLLIFIDDFLTKEEQAEYFEDWNTIFSAIYAYIYTNYLLIENKFNKMYEFIEYTTLEEMDEIFTEANDATYELWFTYRDIPHEKRDYLLSLSLSLLELLKEPESNRITSRSDMELTNPAKVKSAYFFNSIPDVVDDNNCINIILNFMLFELGAYVDKKGFADIAIYFILNNFDTFPNFQCFMKNASVFKDTNISFIYSCSDLNMIKISYDKLIVNKFFNSLNYITINGYDETNLEIINDLVIDIPSVESEYLLRKQILIAQDRVLLTKKFDLTRHDLYYRINF